MQNDNTAKKGVAHVHETHPGPRTPSTPLCVGEKGRKAAGVCPRQDVGSKHRSILNGMVRVCQKGTLKVLPPTAGTQGYLLPPSQRLLRISLHSRKNFFRLAVIQSQQRTAKLENKVSRAFGSGEDLCCCFGKIPTCDQGKKKRTEQGAESGCSLSLEDRKWGA